MNEETIRRKEAMERSLQFFNDNNADLKNTALLVTQFGVIQTELGLMESHMSAQATGVGDAAQSFEIKDTTRENLRAQMSPIARTARRMETMFDGISNKYRMPRNRTDQEMLATARSWVAELPADKDKFTSFGLPGSFIDDLAAAADAFENSFPATITAVDHRVESTAEIGASERRGMVELRTADAIIQNIYANNVGKLAAWLTASHVERPPKKKAPTPTP